MTRLITAKSHPHLFEVCETISHDAGAQAGWSSHVVPDEIEAALAGLTAEELVIMALGDNDQRCEITDRSDVLRRADALLTEFFERYLPTDECPR